MARETGPLMQNIPLEKKKEVKMKIAKVKGQNFFWSDCSPTNLG